MYRLNSLISELSDRWDHASPGDFGALALAIIIAAWFFSKYASR